MNSIKLFIAFWMFSLAGIGTAQETKRNDEDERPAERVQALSRQYSFFTDRNRDTKLVLHPQPLLSYANPIRGDVFGNIFLWSHAGRPEVIGAVFDFRSEDKFDCELHTLARGGIQGCRDDKPFWNPEAPGIKFELLPGAGKPDATHAGRLRQMREIARSITVERVHPEQGTGEMRLLVQPLHRYSSPEAKVTDGAIFVFVEATDPEAFLFLEATSEQRPRWNYAFARMNIVEFSAKRDGKRLWHVDPVSWDTVFDKQEPYAIIREKPSRGLVRSP